MAFKRNLPSQPFGKPRPVPKVINARIWAVRDSKITGPLRSRKLCKS